jgi:hypothetical protein
MTRDDIIRMAREANLPACHASHPVALARFAALVAAAEREACAQVAEGFDACDPKYIAAAIRARRQA